MPTEKTIIELLALMKEAHKDSPGEGSHIDADGYLCDLIRLLAKDHSQYSAIITIVEVYEKMDKWYS